MHVSAIAKMLDRGDLTGLGDRKQHRRIARADIDALIEQHAAATVEHLRAHDSTGIGNPLNRARGQ